jgi:hypothetical protein
MTILRADADRGIFYSPGGLSNQRGGWADNNVGRRLGADASLQRADFRQRGPDPIHFPIAGQQGAHQFIQ